MTVEIWKTLSHILVFLGTLFTLIGGIGIWHFGSEINNSDKEKIHKAITEKNKAISETKELTQKSVELTQLFSSLDNKISTLKVEFVFSKKIVASELENFTIYLRNGLTNYCYIIKSMDIKPKTLAYSIKSFQDPAYEKEISTTEMGTIEKPYITSSIYPLPEIAFMHFNLTFSNRGPEREFTIRDFQDNYFNFFCNQFIFDNLYSIRIITNDLVIFDTRFIKNTWKKLDQKHQWMLDYNEKETIYGLLAPRNDIQSFEHYFNLQKDVLYKVVDRYK